MRLDDTAHSVLHAVRLHDAPGEGIEATVPPGACSLLRRGIPQDFLDHPRAYYGGVQLRQQEISRKGEKGSELTIDTRNMHSDPRRNCSVAIDHRTRSNETQDQRLRKLSEVAASPG